MTTYENTTENAAKVGWDRLPEYCEGDTAARYVTHDKKNNTPLCNLFVNMLNNMGIETESFATSTGKLTW